MQIIQSIVAHLLSGQGSFHASLHVFHMFFPLTFSAQLARPISVTLHQLI